MSKWEKSDKKKIKKKKEKIKFILDDTINK
jgi:hypothetical protein